MQKIKKKPQIVIDGVEVNEFNLMTLFDKKIEQFAMGDKTPRLCPN